MSALTAVSFFLLFQMTHYNNNNTCVDSSLLHTNILDLPLWKEPFPYTDCEESMFTYKKNKIKKKVMLQIAAWSWRLSVSEQGLFQTWQGTGDAYLMLIFWAVSCSCACTTFENWMEGIYKLKIRERKQWSALIMHLLAALDFAACRCRLRMGVRTRTPILGLALHCISLPGAIFELTKHHKTGLTAPT